MRDGLAAVIMAAYGVFRVAAFHPVFRPKYRGWLEQTPWTGRKPLPLGPIHLVWQDVVVLGIVVLALHGTPLGRLWAPWAFLLAYLGTLGVSFWLTGPWWMGYLVLFGLGLAVRLAVEPLVALAALAADLRHCDARARHGAGAVSVARNPRSWKPCAGSFFPTRPRGESRLLGWPNHQLMAAWPDRQDPPPRRNPGAAAGGLVGVRAGLERLGNRTTKPLFPSCCSSTLPLSHSSFGC